MSTKKENMRAFYNQTEYSVINKMIDNNNTNQRFATFCLVVKVNGNRIDAKPLISETLTQMDGEKEIGLPIFKNIPFIKTGYTPMVGDFCVCITLDRPIYGIKKEDYEGINFGVQEEVDNIKLISSKGKVREIGNCIALVGVDL